MKKERPFRLLSKQKFSTLSKDEQVAYLCAAIHAITNNKTVANVIRWPKGSQRLPKLH